MTKMFLCAVCYLFSVSLRVRDQYPMGCFVSFFWFRSNMYPTCLSHAPVLSFIFQVEFGTDSEVGDTDLLLAHLLRLWLPHREVLALLAYSFEVSYSVWPVVVHSLNQIAGIHGMGLREFGVRYR